MFVRVFFVCELIDCLCVCVRDVVGVCACVVLVCTFVLSDCLLSCA